MRVIFLDFDGVLNSTEYLYADASRAEDRDAGEAGAIDPERVAILNRIVDATGALVVVSSSWRYGRSRARLADLLRSRGFTGVVRGCTPDWVRCCGGNGGGEPRGHEIRAWLDEYGEILDVESFVILDDSSDMDGVSDRLVLTDMSRGLTDADADRAIEMLKGDR